MNISVRKILLAALLILLTNHVVLAEPYRHNATGLVFPDRLAMLEKKDEVTDYSAEDPGLGISLGYNGPGIIITVYLYTMGLENIPTDLQSPILQEQFRQAVNDIVQTAKAGYYVDLEKISEGEATWDATKVKSLQASFRFKRNDQDVLSQVHLLGYKNHFLKLRITYAKDFPKEVLEEFFKELASLLVSADQSQEVKLVKNSSLKLQQGMYTTTR